MKAFRDEIQGVSVIEERGKSRGKALEERGGNDRGCIHGKRV